MKSPSYLYVTRFHRMPNDVTRYVNTYINISLVKGRTI